MTGTNQLPPPAGSGYLFFLEAFFQASLQDLAFCWEWSPRLATRNCLRRSCGTPKHVPKVLLHWVAFLNFLLNHSPPGCTFMQICPISVDHAYSYTLHLEYPRFLSLPLIHTARNHGLQAEHLNCQLLLQEVTFKLPTTCMPPLSFFYDPRHTVSLNTIYSLDGGDKNSDGRLEISLQKCDYIPYLHSFYWDIDLIALYSTELYSKQNYWRTRRALFVCQ